ncbi:methyltransferase domain-containing protein [Flavisericum labens]|uniref:methyltransferase domain-containing protein n=1 Tax=Flavisericum labens TaxID=3377112 RepID=UPI00387B7BA9
MDNKNLQILIPGGGNSYEAEYLHSKGFKNTYVVDISQMALSNLKNRANNFPEEHLIHKDFFTLDIRFDIIIEQTFFCAIHPQLRPEYAKKAQELLFPNGKMIGLLFNVPLNQDQPPFGGNKAEYKTYFGPYFNIQIMEEAYNSHNSRTGIELFFKMSRKS